MKHNNGFTLIELMIVIAIIGTMVSYSVPSYHQYTIKSQVKDSYLFAQQLQQSIADFYQQQQRFPKNNQEAGLPPADKLLSNHISAIEIENGTLHLTLGQKINQVAHGKVLSIQPMTVTGSPKSPISWACGLAKSPAGMKKAGNNKTNITAYYLPIQCRI